MVGLAFWLLLLGMWIMLLSGDKASLSNIVDSARYVAVIATLVLAITLYWIRHNVDIHRRKGARKASPIKLPRTDVDRLGRPLRWSLPGGHAAAVGESLLIIELQDGAKVYRRP